MLVTCIADRRLSLEYPNHAALQAMVADGRVSPETHAIQLLVGPRVHVYTWVCTDNVPTEFFDWSPVDVQSAWARVDGQWVPVFVSPTVGVWRRSDQPFNQLTYQALSVAHAGEPAVVPAVRVRPRHLTDGIGLGGLASFPEIMMPLSELAALTPYESRYRDHRRGTSTTTGPISYIWDRRWFEPGPLLDSVWPATTATTGTIQYLGDDSVAKRLYSTNGWPYPGSISLTTTYIPVTAFELLEYSETYPRCLCGTLPQMGSYTYVREWFGPSDELDALWDRKTSGATNFGGTAVPDSLPSFTRLRFGFELETQATMGLTRDSPPRRTDADVEAFALTHMASYIQEHATSLVPRSIDDPIRLDRDNLMDWAGRSCPHKTPAEIIKAAMSQDLVVKYDGTVSGMEITTSGGNSYRTVVAQLVPAAFAVPHSVDSHCSFHIHVSGAAKSATWWGTEAFQWYAAEYLMQHLDQVPQACLDRWRSSEWRDRYYPLSGGSGKRKFVAYRGATVEFRGWGAVSTPAEALVALKLTKQAYIYAIKRCFDATPQVSSLDVGNWSALLSTLHTYQRAA